MCTHTLFEISIDFLPSQLTRRRTHARLKLAARCADDPADGIRML